MTLTDQDLDAILRKEGSTPFFPAVVRTVKVDRHEFSSKTRNFTFYLDTSRQPQDDYNTVKAEVVTAGVVDDMTVKSFVSHIDFYAGDNLDEPVARLDLTRCIPDERGPHIRWRKQPGLAAMLAPLVKVYGGRHAPTTFIDEPSEDFKPGLTLFHEQKTHTVAQYAAMVGAIFKYAWKQIIGSSEPNCSNTFYLDSLSKIAGELSKYTGGDSALSVEVVKPVSQNDR